jgi:hypothetical protein
MKIVILTPTRGRPSGLKRLYDSVTATISGKHQIIFAYYVDNDDETLTAYKELILPTHPNVNIVRYYGERQIIAKAFNYMAQRLTSGSMYFMNGADDMVFDTVGWDDILYQRLAAHPYALYYFDDGIQHEGLATFAVVSQHWITQMGYFFPENIRHNYIDTYIYDVARRAGALVYIPEVKLKHLHFTINNTLYDKTYADAERHWGVDAEAYNNSTDKRIAEAQRIRERIDDWMSQVR